MSIDLKPCPICGDDDLLPIFHEVADGLGTWNIECGECGCNVMHGSEEAVIKRWNTRAAPATQQPVERRVCPCGCNDCKYQTATVLEAAQPDQASLKASLVALLMRFDGMTEDRAGIIFDMFNTVLSRHYRKPEQELGWVIEHQDSPPGRPIYFTGSQHPAQEWSRPGYHEAAMRFARKQDAERAAIWRTPSDHKHRIAEHVWDDDNRRRG